MEVKLAKTAGFCYGVQRAVDAVYEALREEPERRIYTYGPIVHNEFVVGELSQKGVRVLRSREELAQGLSDRSLSHSVIVIRAHGVGADITDMIRGSGLDIRLVDATCPFVKKIHKIVTSHHRAGERIIVTGSPSHPEVIGILGQIDGDADVLETAEEAASYRPPSGKRLCIVSQTTFHLQKFEDIVAILKEKQYNTDIVNTICNATQMRQTEAAELAAECDAMVVIGDPSSSNTAKLCDICRSGCKNTFFIQSAEDLDGSLNSVRCVGITAGASTPKSIIEEVLSYVRNEF